MAAMAAAIEGNVPLVPGKIGLLLFGVIGLLLLLWDPLAAISTVDPRDGQSWEAVAACGCSPHV